MNELNKIAQLNDQLRETFLTGHVDVSRGISRLPETLRQDVMRKVQTYDAFNIDDDPFEEHDLGRFDLNGVGSVIWKIDCYDNDYRCLSPNPADPGVTRRVLMIMLAEEY